MDKKKRKDLLNFDRGADWVPPYVLEQEAKKKEEEQKRRWDNVETLSRSTESGPLPAAPQPQPESDWLSSTITSLLQGPAAGLVAPSDAQTSIGNDAAANLRSIGSGFARVASQAGPIQDYSLQAELDFDAAERARRAAYANELGAAAGEKIRANRQAALEARSGMGPTAAFATEAAGQLANPTTAASLIPVVGPGLAGGLGWLQSYDNARQNNAPEGEAALSAVGDAVWEVLGAKFGNKIGDIADVSRFASSGTRLGGRTAGRALGEGSGETATYVAQSGTNKALDAMDIGSPEFQLYAAQQGEMSWRNLALAFTSGVGAGGALSAPGVAQRVAAENGQMAAELLQILADAQARRARQVSTMRAGDTPRALIGADNSSYIPADVWSVAPGTRKVEADPAAAFISNQTGALPVPPLREAQRGDVSPESFGQLQPNTEVLSAPSKKSKKSKKTAAKDAEETLPAASLAKLLQKNGQAQEAQATTDSGVRAENVVEALGNALGQRDSNILTRLLSSKKVKLVDDATEIPTNAKQMNVAGWYDGRNTYVVANRLSADNTLADLLSVVGHEVKHGVDASGFEHSLGKQANDSIINAGLALAKKGDNAAQLAFQNATGYTNYGAELDETQKREFVAYLINNAIEAPEGRLSAIKRTALSAMRDKARSLGIKPDVVKLEDLKYLTKNMLQSVAESDATLKGDLPAGSDGQAMIVPTKITAAEFMPDAKRVYKDSLGNEKFVLSDKDAVVSTDVLEELAKPENMGSSVPLGVVLEHPDLYNALKGSRLDKNVQITVGPTDNPEAGGNYLPSLNGSVPTITINPKLLTGELVIEDNNGNAVPVRSAILHEVQHAVQDFAGLADQFYTMPGDLQAEKSSVEKSAGNYRLATRKFLDSRTLIKDELPAAAKKQIMSAIFDNRRTMDERADNMYTVLDSLTERGLLTEAVLSEFKQAKREFTRTRDPGYLQDFYDRLYTNYLENINEAEAHHTQDNAEVDTSSVGNPEPSFRTPILRDGDGNVIADRTAMRNQGGMAQLTTPEQRAAALGRKQIVPDSKGRKAALATLRAITGDMWLGAELDEQRMFSGNLLASMALKAEQLRYKLDNAIYNAEKSSKYSREDILNTISSTLEAANELDTAEARTSAIAAIDRKHPGVGTAFNNLRALKWELAQETIMQRVRDGRPVTKKELATYEKIVENAERWTTRAYQSMLTDRGLYAKTFMKRAADPKSAEARKLAAAVKHISSNFLSLPKGKQLEDLSTKQLTKLYNAWDLEGTRGLPEDATEKKAAMIDALQFVNELTGDVVNKKATEIAKDLIGATDRQTGVGSMARGMRQNRTVLEARTDLPKALRDIMGEITDPYMRESLSVARLTQLVAATKNLTDLYIKGEGSVWSSKGDERYTKRLDSPTFGPLDGKWVTQDMYDVLGAYKQYNEEFEAKLKDALETPDQLATVVLGKGMAANRAIARLYKLSNVIGSTANFAQNFGGAFLTVVKNGVNPVNAAKGIRDTAALLYSSKMKNADAARMDTNQELLLAGVTDSAQVQEFRSESWGQLRKQLRDANTDSEIMQRINKLRDVKDAGVELLGDAYAFMDVWAKVATYYQNKDTLSAYNKAEGLGLSEEDIIRQAGYMSTLSTVSYNRAPRIVKAIERDVPFLGGFLTYKAETFRSTLGGVQVAMAYADMLKNAKTPEGKSIARNRMLTQIGGTMAAVAGVTGGMLAYLDQEDEEDKAKRALYPEWERNNIHVYLGRDAKGGEHYASLNRLDPIGPVNDTLVKVGQAMLQDDVTAGDAVKTILGDFVTQFRAYGDVAQTIMDLTAAAGATEKGGYTRETVLDRSFPKLAGDIKNLTPDTNFAANAIAVTENFIPAQVVGWWDVDRLNLQGKDKTKGDILRTAGYKDVVVDPIKSLGFRARDYNKAIQELNTKKNSLLKSSMGPEQLVDELYEIVDRERVATDKLRAATEGFYYYRGPDSMFGQDRGNEARLTKADAYRVFKENRLPTTAVRAVLTGDGRSSVIGNDLLKKYYEVQIKELNPSDPDYKQKKEDAKNKALLLRQALLEKRSSD